MITTARVVNKENLSNGWNKDTSEFNEPSTKLTFLVVTTRTVSIEVTNRDDSPEFIKQRCERLAEAELNFDGVDNVLFV
jgi:hypothetical protein